VVGVEKGFFARHGLRVEPAKQASWPAARDNVVLGSAGGGIDPDKDIERLTVPSTETLQGMRNGTMEAFSTGDPWPFRIVTEDIGYIPALTAQIWPPPPDEFLAVRADWVDKNPKAIIALIKGLIEAQQWADKPENRSEVAKLIGSRAYFNTPVNVLEPALQGKYQLGANRDPVSDTKLGPLYWNSDCGVVSYPYRSLGLWFLVDKVNREDLWRQAATELGLPADQIPAGSSRGKETFFDGIVFDPDDPQAYLDSLAIRR